MEKITAELLLKFKTCLLENEKSKNTIDKYLRDIRQFQIKTGGKLTKAAVLSYKKMLVKQYASASVNSAISSLNSFFDFLGLKELKVKCMRRQRSIFADKERELSRSEYGQLLKAAKNNERLCNLIQTVCSTGIRISELCFITKEAVELGQVHISCKGKLRRIFLSKALCKQLKGYAKKHNIQSGALFVTRSGRPLDRSNIWKMLKKLAEAAGISAKKVFPHNLRHLFARTFYTIHKDIVRLADILGHSSVNTTRIYTLESGEIHRQQMNRVALLLCREKKQPHNSDYVVKHIKAANFYIYNFSTSRVICQ